MCCPAAPASVPSNIPQGCVRSEGGSRWPERRLDRRLEQVAKAVRERYYRLQMPLKLALAVRETVAGHRRGALEGGTPLCDVVAHTNYWTKG